MSGEQSVAIVGPGRMGLALAGAFVQTGAVQAVTVYGRSPEEPPHPLFMQGRATYVFGLDRPRPDCSALFLAVPDAAIPEMAHTVAAHGPAPDGCAAFHLSASLPTEALAPLHARGYAVGSFHPLQTVTHPVTGAERIPGSYVAVMGAPQAVAVARRLTSALGCTLLEVPATRRPLFDAATSLAAGSVPPILELAARLMERAGVPAEDALPALLPLVRSSVDAMAGPGPVAVPRPVGGGDEETLALHLRALDGEDRVLYAVLARQLVRLMGDALPEAAREALTDHLDRVGV